MPKNKDKRRNNAHKPVTYGAGANQDKTLMKATVHGAGTLTSSAGGVINTNISMDPSSYTGTDWGDFSSTYDEFRVMGIRITCANHQFGVAVNGGIMAVAFDNDSAAAPGSFTQVQQYSTSKYMAAVWTSKLQRFAWWRPERGVETTIPWIDVANPSGSLGSVVFYCSGLSATTQYVDLAIEAFIEFRGRR